MIVSGAQMRAAPRAWRDASKAVHVPLSVSSRRILAAALACRDAGSLDLEALAAAFGSETAHSFDHCRGRSIYLKPSSAGDRDHSVNSASQVVIDERRDEVGALRPGPS